MEDALNVLFKKKENKERFLEFVASVSKDADDARYMIFEIISEFLYVNQLRPVMEQVKKKEMGFQHPNFESIRREFQEQDDFLENPPQVQEGIMECKRCHSKRTFSFSKQTRRSDESATVFIRCSNCSFMYKI